MYETSYITVQIQKVEWVDKFVTRLETQVLYESGLEQTDTCLCLDQVNLKQGWSGSSPT